MTGWPEEYARTVLAQVDSTNAEALRRAGQGAGPGWILGLRQTAGRGRRGRAWADPAGNFAASLLLYPTQPAGEVALRSFVASLAVLHALIAVTGRPVGFSLKWPNDVLCNGGKLAGILLESGGNGRHVSHLVIGIGVNLSDVPETARLEASALRAASLMSETGIKVDAEEFLDVLAPIYDRFERQFVAEGFAPIRAMWLDHAAHVGDVVTARCQRDTLTGTFETIDATGNLVLMTQAGRRLVSAGDVFFEEG